MGGGGMQTLPVPATRQGFLHVAPKCTGAWLCAKESGQRCHRVLPSQGGALQELYRTSGVVWSCTPWMPRHVSVASYSLCESAVEGRVTSSTSQLFVCIAPSLCWE